MKSRKLLFSIGLLCSLTIVGCTNINEIDDSDSNSGQITDDVYYHVTFNNYDDSFLYSTLVKENTYATYNGPKPTRPNEGAYSFTFAGWDQPLATTKIINDTVFTAVYTSSVINMYNVSFVNYDGTVLYSTTVKEGEAAVYVGETPVRPDDEDGTTYTFAGWNKDTSSIYRDTVFTAVYSSKLKQFTVRFFNYDEVTLLDIQYATYGKGVNYQGTTPTRRDDGANKYTFSGWDKDITCITQDLDVIATFTSETRMLTVTYVNYDSSFLYSTEVEYGASATYQGASPKRGVEGRFQYVWTGWDTNTDAVYTDLTVTATFERTERSSTTGISYSYDAMNKTYTVTGYSGDEEDVFIPKIYKGLYGEGQVTTINGGAFSNNNTVVTLFIEDNVTTISNNSFWNMSNLKSVRLPNKLKYLTSNYFSGCNYLESLSIPASVESISKEFFNGLNSLCKVTIDSHNPYYSYENGCLYDAKKTILYYCAQYNYVKENLTFPNTLKKICSNAFSSTNKIQSIVFPRSLEEIQEYAFAWCNELRTIKFESSACKIDRYAFHNDTGLQSVDLGDSVISIDDSAFGSIYNLQTIHIPASVQEIHRNAFTYNGFTSITVDSDSQYFKMMDCVLVKADYSEIVIVPRQVERVLTIPANYVGEINYESFRDCNFTGYSVEVGNTKYASNTKMLYTADGTKVLLSTKNITSLSASDFPEGVTTIGEFAFASRWNLSSVVLPNTITNIGNSAFSGTNMNKVTLSDHLEIIGDSAFSGCNNLSSITIPNTVTSIGYYAFNNCGFKSIEIPETVTTLRFSCFSYCNNLTSATINANVTQLEESMFNGCNALRTVTLPSSIESIGSYAFSDCDKLQEIVIPDNVQAINSYAFSSCDLLKTVTLPDGLKYIYSYAFNYCQSLETINWPSALETISDYAFYRCIKISSVTIGSSVSNLNSYCFAYCTSLKSIVIPDNVTYMNRAFVGCGSLETVVLSKNLSNYRLSNYFDECTNLKNIFLNSTEFPNDLAYPFGVNCYLYSESKPESDIGNYWHYVEGVPTVWAE